MQKTAIHAVLTFFILAVIILAASRTAIAQQSTMQFPVERDTGILGWDNHDGWGDPPVFDPDIIANGDTEELANHGLKSAADGGLL